MTNVPLSSTSQPYHPHLQTNQATTITSPSPVLHISRTSPQPSTTAFPFPPSTHLHNFTFVHHLPPSSLTNLNHNTLDIRQQPTHLDTTSVLTPSIVPPSPGHQHLKLYPTRLSTFFNLCRPTSTQQMSTTTHATPPSPLLPNQTITSIPMLDHFEYHHNRSHLQPRRSQTPYQNQQPPSSFIYTNMSNSPPDSHTIEQHHPSSSTPKQPFDNHSLHLTSPYHHCRPPYHHQSRSTPRPHITTAPSSIRSKRKCSSPSPLV